MTSEAKFLPHFALLRTIDVFAFIRSQDYFLSGILIKTIVKMSMIVSQDYHFTSSYEKL